jgi:hypothetical protein
LGLVVDSITPHALKRKALSKPRHFAVISFRIWWRLDAQVVRASRNVLLFEQRRTLPEIPEG